MRRFALLFLLALLALAPGASAATRARATMRAGAASVDFTPPPFGSSAGAAANCTGHQAFSGPRRFAFEEPYLDLGKAGHFAQGDPYLDCNHNGRWDGNFLGGGSDTPRFYTHVLDSVGARAVVVSNGRRTLAVEVVDQEGLFNVYAERIRRQVERDGVHLDGIFISANHDESAPDTLGISGVDAVTSSVNAYFADFLVRRSALAIERAYRARRSARLRFWESREPANLRQCWSSYPFVDDQLMPVLQAVDRRGRAIATLANVSQHAETLGFNPDPGERVGVSSDWVHFFRASLEKRFGGVGIEMAGSVGSVETPQVFSRLISRVPQVESRPEHPAGCRTLFRAHGRAVALGYRSETRAFALALAGAVTHGARGARRSRSATIWGRRADVCLPLSNSLFAVGAAVGVFAARPGYANGCRTPVPPAANGSTSGNEILSQVAAFRIGDGEFVSVPGEVFPFTFLRGPLGPQDMPFPADPLPPWLMPHLHAPYRFVDGLGEDMVGYIFPPGNGVGVPGERGNGIDPGSTDRFGCNHSDDSEAASSSTSVLTGQALVRLLDAQEGRPERVVVGRYVLPGGRRSRDPLGGPVLKCTTDTRFHFARRARAVWVRGRRRLVHPRRWLSLSGRPQRRPDRDTRGYVDRRGRHVWLDVYPDVTR